MKDYFCFSRNISVCSKVILYEYLRFCQKRYLFWPLLITTSLFICKSTNGRRIKIGSFWPIWKKSSFPKLNWKEKENDWLSKWHYTCCVGCRFLDLLKYFFTFVWSSLWRDCRQLLTTLVVICLDRRMTDFQSWEIVNAVRFLSLFLSKLWRVPRTFQVRDWLSLSLSLNCHNYDLLWSLCNWKQVNSCGLRPQKRFFLFQAMVLSVMSSYAVLRATPIYWRLFCEYLVWTTLRVSQ